MYILGIESSCDESAAAIVEDGHRLLTNIVASQEDIHARFGGIIPEVASRQHLLAFPRVVQRALDEASIDWDDVEAIAVTNGPGLAGSLLVGVSYAKALAFAHNKPLVPINHLEGHIYSNWLDAPEPPMPALCLLVSGGHTGLFLMEGDGDYRSLGHTRDDAAGEAFDKVARLLGLGFPGGPAIQKNAQGVDPGKIKLPRAWIPDSDDFSFSGLKTATLHLIRELEKADDPVPVAQVAAAFQESVVDVLVTKTLAAAERNGAACIILGGGVAANLPLRETFVARSPIPVTVAPPRLCTDNGAMIAACGYFRYVSGARAGLDLDISPNLPLV